MRENLSATARTLIFTSHPSFHTVLLDHTPPSLPPFTSLKMVSARSRFAELSSQ
jgi:hypothetical protein